MNDKERRTLDFYDGMREGIALFAHWKDGVQYVGTTGKSLKRALEEIDLEEAERLKIVRET